MLPILAKEKKNFIVMKLCLPNLHAKIKVQIWTHFAEYKAVFAMYTLSVFYHIFIATVAMLVGSSGIRYILESRHLKDEPDYLVSMSPDLVLNV